MLEKIARSEKKSVSNMPRIGKFPIKRENILNIFNQYLVELKYSIKQDQETVIYSILNKLYAILQSTIIEISFELIVPIMDIIEAYIEKLAENSNMSSLFSIAVVFIDVIQMADSLNVITKEEEKQSIKQKVKQTLKVQMERRTECHYKLAFTHLHLAESLFRLGECESAKSSIKRAIEILENIHLNAKAISSNTYVHMPKDISITEAQNCAITLLLAEAYICRTSILPKFNPEVFLNKAEAKLSLILEESSRRNKLVRLLNQRRVDIFTNNKDNTNDSNNTIKIKKKRMNQFSFEKFSKDTESKLVNYLDVTKKTKIANTSDKNNSLTHFNNTSFDDSPNFTSINYNLYLKNICQIFGQNYHIRSKATVVIQCAWRSFKARLECFNRRQILYYFFYIQQTAALKCIVGFLNMVKCVRNLKLLKLANFNRVQERIAEEERQHQACQVIIRYIRGYLDKLARRKMHEEYMKHKACELNRIKYYNTVVIQRWWKLIIVEKKYWRRRNEEIDRENKIKERHNFIFQMATKIASMWRGYTTRKCTKQLKDKLNKVISNDYQKKRESIELIKFVLEEYKLMQERLNIKYSDNRKCVSMGSSILKRSIRNYTEKSNKMNEYAAKIQRRYRCFIAQRIKRAKQSIKREMRILRIEQEQVRYCAAIKIQRWARRGQLLAITRKNRATQGKGNDKSYLDNAKML